MKFNSPCEKVFYSFLMVGIPFRFKSLNPIYNNHTLNIAYLLQKSNDIARNIANLSRKSIVCHTKCSINAVSSRLLLLKTANDLLLGFFDCYNASICAVFRTYTIGIYVKNASMTRSLTRFYI